jgi:hypothetical protein
MKTDRVADEMADILDRKVAITGRTLAGANLGTPETTANASERVYFKLRNCSRPPIYV